MLNYLMACGHVANGKTIDGKPLCVICSPSKESETIKEKCLENNGLKNRMAKCSECPSTTHSRWSLPFFEYRPDKSTDSYYCGCHGWD